MSAPLTQARTPWLDHIASKSSFPFFSPNIFITYFYQGLIDGRVEPEVFTTRLQRELNSSPQPCLVPFLKKSLPYLQVIGMNHLIMVTHLHYLIPFISPALSGYSGTDHRWR